MITYEKQNIFIHEIEATQALHNRHNTCHNHGSAFHGCVRNPVEGCGSESYNHETFWHPWGDHNHRGVDIFAKRGTAVHPAIHGIVLSARHGWGSGGNCVIELGTDWRIHYYAHLDEVLCHNFQIVSHKTLIGKVGNTGNAAGKPCHVHYSISTIYPKSGCHYDHKWFLFFHNPVKELG